MCDMQFRLLGVGLSTRRGLAFCYYFLPCRRGVSPSSEDGAPTRRGASLSVTIFCPLGTVFRRPAGLGRLPGVGQRGPVRGCASQSDAKNRVAGLGRLPGVG